MPEPTVLSCDLPISTRGPRLIRNPPDVAWRSTLPPFPPFSCQRRVQNADTDWPCSMLPVFSYLSGSPSGKSKWCHTSSRCPENQVCEHISYDVTLLVARTLSQSTYYLRTIDKLSRHAVALVHKHGFLAPDEDFNATPRLTLLRPSRLGGCLPAGRGALGAPWFSPPCLP